MAKKYNLHASNTIMWWPLCLVEYHEKTWLLMEFITLWNTLHVKLRITNYNINTISRKNTSSLTISITKLIWSLKPAVKGKMGHSLTYINAIQYKYRSIQTEINRNSSHVDGTYRWLDWLMAFPIHTPISLVEFGHCTMGLSQDI